MKKLIASVLFLAVAFSVNAQKLDRGIRPKPGPAPKIELGKTESFTLPNGLKVYVVENHKLPLVTCSIQFDVYPELEGDMSGYSEFLSELLTAGTKTRTKDELNKEIDFIGARLSASARSMFGRSLKKHQEKLLELMSDIAMNADFKQEELDKIQKRYLSALQAEKNEPDQMLKNVAAVVNYGTHHPYGEIPNEKTVENVNLEKCKEYYSTYYRPNVAYMAIVGDVKAKEMKSLIEKYFGKWNKGEVPKAKYTHPKAPSKANIAFVPRDGSVQSVINVTYPIDLLPGDPEVVKAKVANAILGGGSTGRLFLNLREEHAWTYGSYSSISQDELVGNFTAYAKCRNAVSDSSVAEIINEMNRMRNEKVSDEDLQRQITYMSGSFAIGLENPQTVAQYAINIERFNMPKDYYTNYLQNLSAVTAEDVLSISKKYINPAIANIVVVGSMDEVPKTLERFDSDGKLDYYDNYGNKIEPAKTVAVPEGVTAETIMAAYIKAIGGKKAIESVKDIKTVSKGSVAAGGQQIPITITEVKKAPAKLMFKIEAMGMVINKQVYNGQTGYVEVQGQKQPLDGNDLESAKQQADIYAELHPDQYGIKRTVVGMEKVNGKDAYKMEVVDDKGDKSTEYYSTETGYLVKNVETTENGSQTVEYADYKDAGNGYYIPGKVSIDMGGQKISAEVETVEVNKGVEDTLFN